jgi:hypothetical protein
MRLAKRLGRSGFLIGFLPPFLFYASPPSFFTWESHWVCPLCPYIDMFFATRIAYVQLGLTIGLVCGLLLALTGFAIGYVISRLRHSA